MPYYYYHPYDHHHCHPMHPHPHPDFPVLRSSMGMGPRGYGVTVERVPGDEEGTYRVQFRNTVTGEIEEVSPNLTPEVTVEGGPGLYVCDHDFTISGAAGTYTADPSWFDQDLSNLDVGDTIMFYGHAADEDNPELFHNILGVGTVLTTSPITFKSCFESDVSQSSSYIAEGAVGSDQIADGSVTNAKIADGAVTGDKIGAGAVTNGNIKDNAITTKKIADGAVGTSDLANSSVTSPKIANGAVTTSKLADDAVTWDKIDTSTVPTMSTSTPGIAKVGDGLIMNNGALEVDPNILNTSGGEVLFSDTYAHTYNMNSITLSDSAANYSRLFIEFEDSKSRRGSLILDDPDGSFFEMFTIGGNAAAGAIFRFKSMNINGTTIATEQSPDNLLYNYGVAKISSAGVSSYEDSQEIGIIKVIGFE